MRQPLRVLLGLALAPLLLPLRADVQTPTAGATARLNRLGTRTVVLVVIDGPRASEAFGDPLRRNVPVMSQMTRFGAFFPNFRNEGRTLTNPGHAACLTGVHENLANDGTQRPSFPTVFELYRVRWPRAVDATWFVSQKAKLDALTFSTDPRYGPAFAAQFVHAGSTASDTRVMDLAAGLLRDGDVRLLVINLAQTDIRGHAADWEGYNAAIRTADQLVGALWRFIQSLPSYHGRTTLLVTADHGRHLDGVSNGFVSHGDSCEGCRALFCLMLGPDTPAGRLVPVPYDQRDLAATIAFLLNLSAPDGGQVMREGLRRGVSIR